MSKNWSKEDRYHFDKSEVMRGLETIVLDTLKRVDILQEKIAQQASNVPAMTEDFKALKDAAKEAGEEIEGIMSADDGVVEEDEIAEDALQDEVVDDLRDLVAAALLDGNIKLAYRIERTIDEILEQDISCI